jgi:histidinol-phosphate aminotransferase
MSTFALLPSPGAAQATAYSVPRAGAPIDLFLDGNEGAVPSVGLFDGLRAHGPDLLRRYPHAAHLEAAFAERLGVDARRVLVTAGGDESIDRACRAVLAPGRRLVLPEPTFEMIARYARLAGGAIDSVPWPGGRWPVEAVLAALTPETAMVAIVTPNNPTGGVATAEDVRRVAAAAPQALILVDLAYVEFADSETQALAAVALSLPNALIVRTVSKAWGLAGLRIGYCAGHETLVGWLRACGGPYPVAGPSLALAEAALTQGEAEVAGFISAIHAERDALAAGLAELGARPEPSQANFVLARVRDSVWLRDAFAGFGIGIRAFPGKPMLEDAVRVTCPGSPAQFARVDHALRTALAPEAMLFDLDGVLADVSTSYREAIVQTCAHFGVAVTGADIAAVKAAGNANNDWVVTQRLLAARGVEAALEAVKARFEALYQGTAEAPGLWTNETLRVSRAQLAAWAAARPLAIVTGRPRADLDRFLNHFDLRGFFATTVCMEEAPLKPDPAPVRLALSRLGVTRAWMLGDTPDDQRAARAAGVLPLGVLAPGETDPTPLTRAGAARVFSQPDEWEALWP